MIAMRNNQKNDEPSDRVDPMLVALSAILIPILSLAFILLYAFPNSAGYYYFAWSLKPTMTSMTLGATYLGGAYFFLVVLLSRRWSQVRLGFLPVSAFAATLGIATILHWDRFSHDRLSFQLWAFLYFTIPLVLPILWYRNRRVAAASKVSSQPALDTVSRAAFALVAIIFAGAGLLLLLTPDLMIDLWPWTLTRLTAREMSAIYILPGLVTLGVAYDGNWDGVRYLLQALAFSIVLMFVAVYAARADFDWGHAGTGFFIGGLVLILLLIGFAYRNQGRRHVS